MSVPLSGALLDAALLSGDEEESTPWCLVSGRATFTATVRPSLSGSPDTVPCSAIGLRHQHTFSWCFPEMEESCCPNNSHSATVATAVCDLDHSFPLSNDALVYRLDVSVRFVPKQCGAKRSDGVRPDAGSSYLLPFVWAKLRTALPLRHDEGSPSWRSATFVVPNIHYWRGETPLASSWVSAPASLGGSDDAQEFALAVDDLVASIAWPTTSHDADCVHHSSKPTSDATNALELQVWLPTRRTVRQFFSNIRSYVARRQLVDDTATAAAEWASVAAEVEDGGGSNCSKATWSRRSPESAFRTAVQRAVASAPVVRLRDGSGRVQKVIAHASAVIVFLCAGSQ